MPGQLARYVRTSLIIIFVGTTGAIMAGIYYVMLAIASESNRNFVPLSAFATLAAYRVFEEHSLPLPIFTSGPEEQGRPCFTAGMPTPGLAGGFPCRLSVELVGAPGPLPCSTWRREVCNVLALPAAMHRNEAFQTAFQGYISDPCRFVQDYRQFRDRLDAAAVSTAFVAHYARVIEADFRCTTQAANQPSVGQTSNVWRRMRTYVLLEGTVTQPASFIEVRIKLPEK